MSAGRPELGWAVERGGDPLSKSASQKSPPMPSPTPNARYASVCANARKRQASRLLIVSSNLELLRGHYQDVITRLAESGVEVNIRFFKESLLDPEEFEARFRDAGLAVRVQREPKQIRRASDRFALRLRELGNILRFAHPDYAGRTVLAERAVDKTTPGVQRCWRWLRRLGTRGTAHLAGPLRLVESVLPPSVSAARAVSNDRPDVIVAIPVIRNPGLVDYLKAGARANVATAIWVQSWDNLTNKGLLHFRPERVFVWNERQEAELSRYHAVPPTNVCITGAQTFDHWFEHDEVLTRSAFCAELGVDPERPIVLYLASSRQIAPSEPDFFERWLATVRASEDPMLRSASVLLRPHPTLAKAWHARGFEREPSVAISPSTLSAQINSDAFRAQYRNELHHATVVAGVNTSGFIDAAIFGKPACTVELPELSQGQGGTIHFQHLTRPGAELLRVSATLEEHAALLAELVKRDAYAVDETSVRFVSAFVRPHGMDVRPTDVFTREMLELLKGSECDVRPRQISAAAGRLIGSIAFLLGAPLERRPGDALLEHMEAFTRFAYRALRRDPQAADVFMLATTRKPLRRRAAEAGRRAVRRILPAPLRRAIRTMFPISDS
jgi:hypothetical protein